MMTEKMMFGTDYPYYLTRVTKAKTILEELEKHTKLHRDTSIKVLAVGGHYGFIEYALSKWTKWNIISSDINETSIMKYPELKKHISLQVLDSTNLPFNKESFDLVILNHVIEHIPNYVDSLTELHRVLKKQGILYLATPNRYRLAANMKILYHARTTLTTDTRMQYHIGYSKKELDTSLSLFAKKKNISRTHVIQNAKGFRCFVSLIPQQFILQHVQTHVYICQK